MRKLNRLWSHSWSRERSTTVRPGEVPTKSARLNFMLQQVAQICDHIFVQWHNILQHMNQRTSIPKGKEKCGGSCVRRNGVTVRDGICVDPPLCRGSGLGCERKNVAPPPFARIDIQSLSDHCEASSNFCFLHSSMTSL